MLFKILTPPCTPCNGLIGVSAKRRVPSSVLLFLLACCVSIANGADINEDSPTKRLEGFHTFTATPSSVGGEIRWNVDKAVNGRVSAGFLSAVGTEVTFKLDWDRGDTTYIINANDNGSEDELMVQVFPPDREVRYQFRNPLRSSPPVSVRILVPSSLNPDTKAISVHHGSSRANYFAYWKDWGMQEGWIILAPHFPDSGKWEGSRGYNLGNMFTGRDGAGRLNPEDQWAYRIAVDFATSMVEGFDLNDKTFDMWGHSAGGQFTHRAMLFIRDAPIRRGMPANPGWWTLPVFDEQDRNVKYPYGLYHPQLDYDEQDILRFTNMQGFVHAGNRDTSRTNGLRTTPEAEAQGRNRWQRANNMFTTIATSNSEHNWTFFKADGIGHDGERMSKSAQQWLENNPVDPTELQISRVTATNITDTSVVVTWTTNTPADSLVNYGLDASYGLSAAASELVTSHSIPLSSLEPSTQYHYQVISRDGNGEPVASQNFTFATLGATGGIDLIVDELSAPPGTVGPGSLLNFSVTALNQGDQPAAANFLRLVLSTDAVIDQSDQRLTRPSLRVPSLEGGARHQASGTVTIPADVIPGRYFLGAIVDPSNRVTESNETNNTRGVPVTVTGVTGDGADLIISQLGAASNLVAPGAMLSYTIEALNQGNGGADRNFLRLVLSRDPVINRDDRRLTRPSLRVPALAAGTNHQSSGQVAIPADVVPGNYFFGAIVDPSERVPESDESNNTSSGVPITVRASNVPR